MTQYLKQHLKQLFTPGIVFILIVTSFFSPFAAFASTYGSGSYGGGTYGTGLLELI